MKYIVDITLTFCKNSEVLKNKSIRKLPFPAWNLQISCRGILQVLLQTESRVSCTPLPALLYLVLELKILLLIIV